MKNFFETLLSLLKQDERFFSTDGQLLRNAVIEAAMKFDKKLLKILLDDETARKYFFEDVDGVKVSTKLNSAGQLTTDNFFPTVIRISKIKSGSSMNTKILFHLPARSIWFSRTKIAYLKADKLKTTKNATKFFITKLLLPTKLTDFLNQKFSSMQKNFLPTVNNLPLIFPTTI